MASPLTPYTLLLVTDIVHTFSRYIFPTSLANVHSSWLYFKGVGGGVKMISSVFFYIFSGDGPAYLLSKMGSTTSQLQTVGSSTFVIPGTFRKNRVVSIREIRKFLDKKNISPNFHEIWHESRVWVKEQNLCFAFLIF